MTPTWTDDRVARLKQLHAANFSFAQIAADLGGITRNAAIGKAGRLGLSCKGWSPNSRPKPVKSSKPRKQRFFARAATKITAEQAAIKCSEITPLLVGLLDLQLNECRYPFGDGPFLFCARQTAVETSYCSEHQALCMKHLQAEAVAA